MLLAAQEGKVDRFCDDYKKPNNVTKADAFPIPHVEDFIDQVGQSHVTKVDLLKGDFWVPLTEHQEALESPSTQGSRFPSAVSAHSCCL